MLQFGILGIGQCGSSIAEYAYRKGFKAVIANTAEVDLKKIEYIPNDCKIYLGGGGAGRERAVGASYMVDSVEKVLGKCRQQFENCDAVFVAASAAGGTGSGALPIGLEILMSFKKYVGCIVALPEDIESPKSKMNTLDCFSQVSQLDDLGSVFIIDNEKAKQLNPNLSRRQIYNVTNKHIIDLLTELNSLTICSSYVSNFDSGDLLSIIRERGYTLISKIEYYSNSEDKYQTTKKIRDSWNQSYQPYFEDGQILKGAILGKVLEKESLNIDPDLIFQETGIPYDFNDAYFEPENASCNKYKSTFYTILSGLPFPSKRLGGLNKTIKKIEEKLIDNFNTSQKQKFECENWGEKFISGKVVNLDFNKRNNQNDKIDLLDRLSKYKK